jgi:hypothetical protein
MEPASLIAMMAVPRILAAHAGVNYSDVQTVCANGSDDRPLLLGALIPCKS